MPKVVAELRRPHAERRLEQQPCAPVEELEEAAVEYDAGRIAMTPFDGELPAIDEIGHTGFGPDPAAHRNAPLRPMSIAGQIRPDREYSPFRSTFKELIAFAGVLG